MSSRGSIAYLVGRYPSLSHTFISREVRALRRVGLEVTTFAIWATPSDELLTETDQEDAASTIALLPAGPLRLLRDQAAALIASPAAYVELLARALRAAPAGVRGRFLALSWVAETAMLWRELRARGIRHVHAHLPGTAPAVAMLVTRIANRAGGGNHTWSLTVHGPSEVYNVNENALSLKLRDSDFAVAISDFGRSQLMGLVEEEHWSKLHVVHCGVEPRSYESRQFPPDPETAGRTRLITVGRLAPVKGQGLLLEAVQQLRRRGVDVSVAVVGDGPRRAALEERARRLGISESVEFTGPVGQDEIARHYLNADIYVHASFAEGIPVVLMEAMAHGLPVVATRVMGVPELVRDGENGKVVRPGRLDELVDAIDRLIRDPAARERFADAGARTIETEFDVNIAAGQLRALFDRYASP